MRDSRFFIFIDICFEIDSRKEVPLTSFESKLNRIYLFTLAEQSLSYRYRWMSGLKYLKLGSTLSNICNTTELDDATKCHYAFKYFWGEPWIRFSNTINIKYMYNKKERKVENSQDS